MSSAKVLEVCKARHAYATTVADQLAFAAGDLLHIVQKNGGWWKAIKVANPAEQGWVPSNYLSVVKADGSLDKVLVTPRTQAGQVRPETIVTTGGEGEGAAAAAATSPVAASASSASAGGIPSTNGQPFLYAVRALHKYSATRADGLSFDAGEVMSIVDKKDGWLRAFNAAGADGWVPSNYTTQIEGAPAASAAAASPTASAASPAAAAAVAAAVAADTDEEEASPAPARKLKALSTSEEVGQSSGAPVSSPTPRPDVPPLDVNMTPRVDQPTPRAPDLPTDSQVSMTPRHALSGTETPEEEYRDQVGDLTITPRMQASIGVSTERVRALYNFDAKKADHLSFKKGDIMVVLKKKAGWWKVHHEHSTGKLGYIPSNYVKALVEAEPITNPTTTTILAAATAGGSSQTVVQVAVDFEPTKERPLLVKASHNYKALANNQLSFSKGDLLHVIHKNKGWWKSFRVQDAEKIGYIPSNYVKVVGPGEAPANAGAGASAGASAGGEGATANGSASASSTSPAAASAASPAAAAAAAPVMEEVAIALHDLEKKDPKCLALKRDERFAIHDKLVGGGWWRCTSLYSGDTGLVPSNFLRTEMAPARAPPPLPPARGSIPNAATFFVEGTYDFTAKKSSQLSYKKYDILVVIKKDGSWWKVRNKIGKEGMIPFNYVKEVPTPPTFVAVFGFQARNASELSFAKDEVLTIQDLEAPGWWGATNSSGAKGLVPSTYVHPISARVPGMSAPPTPRSAIEPDVPATPRNPDGTLRADPAVAANTVPSVAVAAAVGVGGVVATPVLIDTFKPLVVQSGSVDPSASANHARALSGSISASPVAHATTKDTVQFLAPTKSSALGSVTVPPRQFADPAATPRPEFISDQVIPVRGMKKGPVGGGEEGRSSAAPAAAAEPAPEASSNPLGAISGFFGNILPTQLGGKPAADAAAAPESEVAPKKGPAAKGEEGRSSAPADAAPAPAPEAASSSPLGALSGFFDNILPSQLGGKPAAAAGADAAASSSSPAQVEGQPSSAAVAAGAGAGAGAAAPYAFYSGEEGEGRAEGDAADATNPLNAQAAAAKRRQEAADREAAENGSTTGSTNSKAEIGSTNDPRIRSGAELNNRGACSGGWSSFMGLFACTGGDRASGNVPKPGEGSTKEEEEEKQQHK